MEDEYVINGDIIKDTLAMSILSGCKKIRLIQTDIDKLAFNFSNQIEFSDLVAQLDQKILNDTEFDKIDESVEKVQDEIKDYIKSDFLKLENYLLKIVADILRKPERKTKFSVVHEFVNPKYNPLKIDAKVIKLIQKL